MKAAESVLLYNVSDKNKERIMKTILIQMGIKIKSADHSGLNQTIGSLLGIKGYEVGVSEETEKVDNLEPFSEELIVMRAFNEKRLNQFLSSMRKAGLPKIPYKAVVTPTNESWTLKQLYLEIEREHKKMSGIE